MSPVPALAGRTCTTSPAPTVNVPSSVPTTRAPVASMSSAWPRRTSPAGRSTSDGPAERHAHVGVRPAQRVDVVEQRPEAVERAQHLAEQVGAVHRLAGLERRRRGERDRELVEGLGDVDADADDRRRTVGGLDPLDQDAAELAPASSTSTSLGHFRATSGSRSASAAWTAYPVSSGSHGHDAAGTSGRSSTENVSDERAGVSQARSSRPRPAVWCSADQHQPRLLGPARARSATAALVEGADSTTSTRQPRASPAGRGRGVGEVPGWASWALDCPRDRARGTTPRQTGPATSQQEATA